TKSTTGIVFTWPESSKTTRSVVTILKIGWWVFWIFAVTQMMQTFYLAYTVRNSFMQLIHNLFHAFCMNQVVLTMIIGKHHHHRFQYLIEEIETFMKDANSHEREVLSKCVKRIASRHFSYNIIAISATLGYILGPITLDYSLPNRLVYPFAVDEHPSYDIAYLWETIGAIECCCSTAFICQVCLLLWYGTIQLEILAEKMRKVSIAQDLKEYINVHHHILWYIDETIKTVRPVVLTTVAMAMITILCAGITIVGNGPIIEKLQFMVIVMTFSIELLCVAWAAENLTAACEEVSWALYNRAVIFVMQRCQKPSVISIGGLLPKLSMNYYARYMSATYSFFTTLRVVLRKIEDDL
ncbi:odorant receptor 67NTE, partial [Diachasma alloeum]